MNTKEVKKEDCIGHVQIRLGTALRSYKKKRWVAALSDGKGTGSKDVTDPIIYCMQTAMGMLSTTKVIKSLLLQLVGPSMVGNEIYWSFIICNFFICKFLCNISIKHILDLFTV